MRGTDDQRAAARQEAALIATDLHRVTGLLEEVATVWRRAERDMQQRSSSFAPGSLQDAARNLADAVRDLPDADADQHPALAFSAAAQLAELGSSAAVSEALTGGDHLGDGHIWVAIRDGLQQAGERLWSLISHLVKIGESSPSEDVTTERGSLATSDQLSRPTLPAAGSEAPLRALAAQRTAIDALPEIDLRRLLGLIGGMDPAALQRAAAVYTETFCTVTETEASVAALRPVVLLHCNCPQDPGQVSGPSEPLQRAATRDAASSTAAGPAFSPKHLQ
jgi:hypothetical protein